MFKLLGFPIDNTLNFTTLSNHLISKLTRCSTILQRSKYFLSITSLKIIFNAIGLSYINYFAIILRNCKLTDISKIENRYKHCGAVIFNCFYNALHLYNWPDLSKHLFKIQAIFVFKVIKLKYAPNLFKSLISNNVNRPYTLRNSNNLQISRFNRSIGQKSFNYWATKIWNSLSIDIQNCSSLHTFKSKL